MIEAMTVVWKKCEHEVLMRPGTEPPACPYCHIKELKAQVAAVSKCPVYFEGGVMTIGDDGLFPVGGVMTVVAVMQALKPGE